jgi:hypothetical protein
MREAAEELGLDVSVDGLVATVHFGGSEQYDFLARSVGGTFGAAAGRRCEARLTRNPAAVAQSGWRQTRCSATTCGRGHSPSGYGDPPS